MLYLFSGTNTVGVREKAFSFLATLEEKGMNIVRLTAEQYLPGMLLDYASAASLFSEPQVVLIDTPSEKKEVFEDVLSQLGLLAESANTFVVLEGKMLAPEKKKFGKYAEKVLEVAAEESKRFNTFLFADALLRKDKKSLWLLFAEATHEGIAAEEIIGVLFWQLKALRLAALTKTAQEAGLKDFVYTKAKRALSKFSEDELSGLSKQLIALYHDGHSGKRDISLSLEKFLLTV